MRALLTALGLAASIALISSANAQTVTKSHGQTLFGTLKYPPDFAHFDYVRPDAPKGGQLVLSATGTFDSFNQFIVKGTPAAGVGFLFESLMTGSLDEADTSGQYGLIAESVEVPDDFSWVIYNLRHEARWHDGKPLTADDVIFSFEALTTKGHPFFRAYYQNVIDVEKLGPHRVRFSFNTKNNRELPHIMGQLTILPKHFYDNVNFEESSLVPPVGSGPYRVKGFEAGRSINYERVDDYWGAQLPVNVGHYNFDEIRYDYYRDTTVALEAFKGHEYDYRAENTAKNWATGYNVPALDQGLFLKEEWPDRSSHGMQGFIFNIRKPIFNDVNVREAISLAFDFEWANKTLFYGQYTRTTSYFESTGLEAEGLPTGLEREILEPHRAALPPRLFTEAYNVPTTDGSGTNRRNMRKAASLLREAGWQIVDGVLSNEKSGKPLEFEVLLIQPEFERIVLPFARNLKKLGIEVRVRPVDTSQYINRRRSFDFDMIVDSFGQSFSPGNEQRDFWGSDRADTPGSRNLIGVKDPVIDALIDRIIEAPDREHLAAATRALDRVLLWNHFVIPQWHVGIHRIAYWNKFGQPETRPKFGIGIMSWWIDPEKLARLDTRKKESR